MNAPGIYFGTLKDFVLGETSGNKKPQVVVQFTVTHRSVAGEWEPFGPQDRKAYFSLSGKAFSYTTNKLVKLGWNKTFDDKMEITPPADSDGKPVGFQLECTNETYQGKTKERWDLAGFVGGGMDAAPLGNDMVHRLNALYAQQEGDQAAATAPSAPKAAAVTTPVQAADNAPSEQPASPTGAASTIPNDDIPF